MLANKSLAELSHIQNFSGRYATYISAQHLFCMLMSDIFYSALTTRNEKDLREGTELWCTLSCMLRQSCLDFIMDKRFNTPPIWCQGPFFCYQKSLHPGGTSLFS